MNSQLARVAAVALWTAVCIGLCMATGCVGSVWFAALIVALVVYGLVRR